MKMDLNKFVTDRPEEVDLLAGPQRHRPAQGTSN